MKILITGGAGFIGINSSSYFLKKGYDVVILDNFSRKGSKSNVEWLRSLKWGNAVKVIEGDIRDITALKSYIEDIDVVINLAGQVAVTSSVVDPWGDFENNALGTFNVLEAARLSKKNPIVIYSSTNKVYGDLDHIGIIEEETRYSFKNHPNGIDESENLDFHSPYGCSKGAGDQYTRDYYRIYNLPTVVFRQSCIYGPRQFGVEDQGWVAWFIIAVLLKKEITIYGNGKQVRDLLYVDDLIRAYELAIENIDTAKGKIYNIGGGPNNSLSVWYELKPILEKLYNRKIHASFAPIRSGDQPVFIANLEKVSRELNWRPTIGVQEGVERLFRWVRENEGLFV